jgi:hypothetical protein
MLSKANPKTSLDAFGICGVKCLRRLSINRDARDEQSSAGRFFYFFVCPLMNASNAGHSGSPLQAANASLA